MGPDQSVAEMQHLLIEAVVLCSPLLISAGVVSLLVSLLQTLTGIQEQTLTAVPRLVIVVAVTIISMPWTIHRLVSYTLNLLHDFHRYIQ